MWTLTHLTPTFGRGGGPVLRILFRDGLPGHHIELSPAVVAPCLRHPQVGGVRARLLRRARGPGKPPAPLQYAVKAKRPAVHMGRLPVTVA